MVKKTLEKGQDKIQQICYQLRNETLEPAKQEADELIQEAKHRSEKIIAESEAEAEQILENARLKIQQEKNVFQTSLEQAATQAVETLKQSIENKLFDQKLTKIIEEETSKTDVIADLIKAIVKSIEKEGITANIEAVVPKVVTAKDINNLVGKEVLKKLQKESVVVGEFNGGAEVKLVDKKITIEITDTAIKELLVKYRKDFRKILFAS